MRSLVLVIALIAMAVPGVFAEARKPARTKGVAVAFYDEPRLLGRGGRDELKNFQYYFKQIQEIAARDFPEIELRVLQKGQLAHLPDGTNLNVETMRPDLGYVLSANGKKRRVMTGVQTDADFACAAATFFKRPSPSCPK
jgi:hypothetical protein